MAARENLHLSDEQLVLVVDYIEQKYGKPAWALLMDKETVVTPLGSRLGGLPYWDFAKEYPQDKDGDPLRFFGQINLSEFEHHGSELPEKGLLQFFFKADDDLMGVDFEANDAILKSTEALANSNQAYRVVYHEHIPQAEDVSWEGLEQQLADKGLDKHKIANYELDEYWAVLGECALKLAGYVDMPHFNDQEFFTAILKESLKEVLHIDKSEQANWYLILDDQTSRQLFLLLDQRGGLSQEEEGLRCGHLLGYPDFIQYNPFDVATEQSKERYDTLLCLFEFGEASDLPKGPLGQDNFEMLWGDCGIADLFMSGAKLKEQDFSDIFYTWDCS